MELLFFVDLHGFRRVVTPPGYEGVGDYLEQDVQGDISFCNELPELLSKVRNGEVANWEGTGNAHTLTIDRDGVLIENVWDEELPNLKLSHKEFEEAINGWKHFICSINSANGNTTE